MRKSLAIGILGWLLGTTGVCPATQPASPSPAAMLSATTVERFAGMELLFCFQGKGSCLPYDAGVLHEVYARVPSLRQGKTIVGGVSSGSIPAAFFCCFGFNDATVRLAEERLKYGDRSAVRGMESLGYKISKVVRGQPTELPHTDLREYVAFALGVASWKDATTLEEIVRRSTAGPRFPCLIVAANQEVLEDRHPEDSLSPGRLKEIDPETMVVSWKPEVYAFYQDHPDHFRRDHPRLVLGPDRRIGRAATFFVDRSMYELLRQVPDEERIADLRLMTSAADVALAIMASTSEPTYFPAVLEPDPSQLYVGHGEALQQRVRQRAYYGGFILPTPAQDVRRMLPGIRVLGTGYRHMPYLARRFLRNTLLADCEELAMRNDWWADMEINPDSEIEQHFELRDLSGEEEYDFGRQRTRELLDRDQGLAIFVKPPRFRNACPQAVLPNFVEAEMYQSTSGASPTMELKTMRGLGPLLNPR
jgi:hypothetical protein